MIAIYKYLIGDPSIEKKLFSEMEFKKTHDHSLQLEDRQFNLNLHRGVLYCQSLRDVELSSTSRPP